MTGTPATSTDDDSWSSSATSAAAWRVGFVVGNALGIKGLGQVKTNVDSGVFKAIQKAAIAAFQTTS